MASKINALENLMRGEAVLDARPDIRGRFGAEVLTITLQRASIPMVEFGPLSGSPPRGSMVQRAIEDVAAQIVPVRLGIYQVQMPHFIHRLTRGDGKPEPHREVKETPIFGDHSLRIFLIPAVLPGKPIAKRHRCPGRIENELFQSKFQFVSLWIHKISELSPAYAKVITGPG